MRVRTVLIIFGAFEILGMVFFTVGSQGWIVGQASSLVTGSQSTTPAMFWLAPILMRARVRERDQRTSPLPEKEVAKAGQVG